MPNAKNRSRTRTNETKKLISPLHQGPLHSRLVLALLLSAGVAATACSSFDSDPAAAVPDPGNTAPGADGGDGGAFPPVMGTPGQDSGADTGRDAAGDAPAPAWTPKDLPGLAVWLDNTTGLMDDGSGNITGWLDQSANQNKAAPAAPCVAPTRAANSLNGHDTLAFPGTARTCLVIADSPSVQFGTGDFAIFMVARHANVPSTNGANNLAYLWSKQPANGIGGMTFYGNTSTDANMNLSTAFVFTTGTTTGLNDNTFRRFGGTRRGVDLELWVDGAAEAKKAVTLADVSQVGRPLALGAVLATPTDGSLIGDLAEVVAVKGNLTDAQIAKLDGYFKTKHGL